MVWVSQPDATLLKYPQLLHTAMPPLVGLCAPSNLSEMIHHAKDLSWVSEVAREPGCHDLNSTLAASPVLNFVFPVHELDFMHVQRSN